MEKMSSTIFVFIFLGDSVILKCIKLQDGEGVGRKGSLPLSYPERNALVSRFVSWEPSPVQS